MQTRRENTKQHKTPNKHTRKIQNFVTNTNPFGKPTKQIHIANPIHTHTNTALTQNARTHDTNNTTKHNANSLCKITTQTPNSKPTTKNTMQIHTLSINTIQNQCANKHTHTTLFKKYYINTSPQNFILSYLVLQLCNYSWVQSHHNAGFRFFSFQL